MIDLVIQEFGMVHWAVTIGHLELLGGKIYGMIVVLADPSKYSGEHFIDEPSPGYWEGCACAIQNIMLAAPAQGLGTF